MQGERPAGFEQAGELKFGQVGIANLRVRSWDVDRLIEDMRERVERAPQLFARAAVIVDVGSLAQCPPPESMQRLLDGLRATGVYPVALGFGTRDIDALSRALDLPLLAKFRAQYESVRTAPAAEAQPPPATEPAPAPAPAATQSPPPRGGSQLHPGPIRSGQQVYAQGDLTVCAGVSAGAEVIAEGSIHVYGALRGRALAGAQGDEQARIFCREFHAELVAIAGQYRVIDELPAALRGKPVQVWLEDGRLHLAELA